MRKPISRRKYCWMKSMWKAHHELRKYEFPTELRAFVFRIPFVCSALYLETQVWRDRDAEQLWNQLCDRLGLIQP